MKKFEYKGEWWLPESPNKKIIGLIKFDPYNGGILELYGSFKDFNNLKQNTYFEIINGQIFGGRMITLCKCYASHFSFDGRGSLESRFYVNYILIGEIFTRYKDIVFNKLRIHYAYFDEWLEITSFYFKKEQDPQRQHKGISLVYKYPKEIEIKLNDFKLNIIFEYSHDLKRYEIHIKQKTMIEIVPNEKVHLDVYLTDLSYNIQNFISFGIGKATFPLELIGILKNKASKLDEIQDQNNIEIYYRNNNYTEEIEFIHPDKYLFTVKDIEPNFKKCFITWIKKAEMLKSVYDLYFAILYNPNMYIEHQFLTLIQAIEAYHRRIFNGKYLTEEKFSSILKQLHQCIPDQIPQNFKEKIKNSLHYLNEFSLRKRLKELLKDCKKIIELPIKNQDKFISDVVSTRNYLIHYDKQLEKIAKRGNELYYLIQLLTTITQLLLLKELELLEEKISEIIKRRVEIMMLENK